ncbi:hypothetical protein CSUI_003958 [Cystoisospora suis]|uniref:Transmembrane protein n=1 Tax=Cystoisospora suis TaxID=483139 RepID=A0A2C6L2Y0_9APIC|nr:hypothetical protein CSUI_003958 [Cystoisospora suis]
MYVLSSVEKLRFQTVRRLDSIETDQRDNRLRPSLLPSFYLVWCVEDDAACCCFCSQFPALSVCARTGFFPYFLRNLTFPGVVAHLSIIFFFGRAVPFSARQFCTSRLV